MKTVLEITDIADELSITKLDVLRLIAKKRLKATQKNAPKPSTPAKEPSGPGLKTGAGKTATLEVPKTGFAARLGRGRQNAGLVNRISQGVQGTFAPKMPEYLIRRESYETMAAKGLTDLSVQMANGWFESSSDLENKTRVSFKKNALDEITDQQVLDDIRRQDREAGYKSTNHTVSVQLSSPPSEFVADLRGPALSRATQNSFGDLTLQEAFIRSRGRLISKEILRHSACRLYASPSEYQQYLSAIVEQLAEETLRGMGGRVIKTKDRDQQGNEFDVAIVPTVIVSMPLVAAIPRSQISTFISRAF